MTIEELDKKIKLMIACDRLKNHNGNPCKNCGMITRSFGYGLSLDIYLSLIALSLMNKGIKNFLDGIRRYNSKITYKEEKSIAKYLSKLIPTIRNKKIKHLLRTIHKISGINDGNEDLDIYYGLLAPTKENVEIYGGEILGNRILTKEWFKEIKDAKIEIKFYTEIRVDANAYLDYVDYKIKTNREIDVLNMIEHIFKFPSITVKAYQVPYLPPHILFRNFNRIKHLSNYIIETYQRLNFKYVSTFMANLYEQMNEYLKSVDKIPEITEEQLKNETILISEL